jgi:hypothetical protein
VGLQHRLCLLLVSRLALRGIISLGHVANVRLLFDIVMDDVTLILTQLCGVMTLFLGS